MSRVFINIKGDFKMERSCVFTSKSVADLDSAPIPLVKNGNVSYVPTLACHVTSGARHNRPTACYALVVVEYMPPNEEGYKARLTYKRVDHSAIPASWLGFDDIHPSYVVDSVYMIGDQVYSKVHEVVLRRERWMHHVSLQLFSMYDFYPALVESICREGEGVDVSEDAIAGISEAGHAGDEAAREIDEPAREIDEAASEIDEAACDIETESRRMIVATEALCNALKNTKDACRTAASSSVGDAVRRICPRILLIEECIKGLADDRGCLRGFTPEQQATMKEALSGCKSLMSENLVGEVVKRDIRNSEIKERILSLKTDVSSFKAEGVEQDVTERTDYKQQQSQLLFGQQGYECSQYIPYAQYLPHWPCEAYVQHVQRLPSMQCAPQMQCALQMQYVPYTQAGDDQSFTPTDLQTVGVDSAGSGLGWPSVWMPASACEYANQWTPECGVASGTPVLGEATDSQLECCQSVQIVPLESGSGSVDPLPDLARSSSVDNGMKRLSSVDSFSPAAELSKQSTLDAASPSSSGEGTVVALMDYTGSPTSSCGIGADEVTQTPVVEVFPRSPELEFTGPVSSDFVLSAEPTAAREANPRAKNSGCLGSKVSPQAETSVPASTVASSQPTPASTSINRTADSSRRQGELEKEYMSGKGSIPAGEEPVSWCRGSSFSSRPWVPRSVLARRDPSGVLAAPAGTSSVVPLDQVRSESESHSEQRNLTSPNEAASGKTHGSILKESLQARSEPAGQHKSSGSHDFRLTIAALEFERRKKMPSKMPVPNMEELIRELNSSHAMAVVSARMANDKARGIEHAESVGSSRGIEHAESVDNSRGIEDAESVSNAGHIDSAKFDESAKPGKRLFKSKPVSWAPSGIRSPAPPASVEEACEVKPADEKSLAVELPISQKKSDAEETRVNQGSSGAPESCVPPETKVNQESSVAHESCPARPSLVCEALNDSATVSAPVQPDHMERLLNCLAAVCLPEPQVIEKASAVVVPETRAAVVDKEVADTPADAPIIVRPSASSAVVLKPSAPPKKKTYRGKRRPAKCLSKKGGVSVSSHPTLISSAQTLVLSQPLLVLSEPTLVQSESRTLSGAAAGTTLGPESGVAVDKVIEVKHDPDLLTLRPVEVTEAQPSSADSIAETQPACCETQPVRDESQLANQIESMDRTHSDEVVSSGGPEPTEEDMGWKSVKPKKSRKEEPVSLSRVAKGAQLMKPERTRVCARPAIVKPLTDQSGSYTTKVNDLRRRLAQFSAKASTMTHDTSEVRVAPEVHVIVGVEESPVSCDTVNARANENTQQLRAEDPQISVATDTLPDANTQLHVNDLANEAKDQLVCDQGNDINEAQSDTSELLSDMEDPMLEPSEKAEPSEKVVTHVLTKNQKRRVRHLQMLAAMKANKISNCAVPQQNEVNLVDSRSTIPARVEPARAAPIQPAKAKASERPFFGADRIKKLASKVQTKTSKKGESGDLLKVDTQRKEEMKSMKTVDVSKSLATECAITAGRVKAVEYVKAASNVHETEHAKAQGHLEAAGHGDRVSVTDDGKLLVSADIRSVTSERETSLTVATKDVIPVAESTNTNQADNSTGVVQEVIRSLVEAFPWWKGSDQSVKPPAASHCLGASSESRQASCQPSQAPNQPSKPFVGSSALSEAERQNVPQVKSEVTVDEPRGTFWDFLKDTFFNGSKNESSTKDNGVRAPAASEIASASNKAGLETKQEIKPCTNRLGESGKPQSTSEKIGHKAEFCPSAKKVECHEPAKKVECRCGSQQKTQPLASERCGLGTAKTTAKTLAEISEDSLMLEMMLMDQRVNDLQRAAVVVYARALRERGQRDKSKALVADLLRVRESQGISAPTASGALSDGSIVRSRLAGSCRSGGYTVTSAGKTADSKASKAADSKAGKAADSKAGPMTGQFPMTSQVSRTSQFTESCKSVNGPTRKCS